jgi:Zn-dependent protease with chaperone function
MHAVLIISSLLIVTLGGVLLLSRLRRIDRWTDRRELQIAVLAAPMLSLGIAVVGLRHFTGRLCFVSTPTWDYLLGVALPVGIGLAALGVITLGFVRLFFMHRSVLRRGLPADAHVQSLAVRLAQERRGLSPQVRQCLSHRPLALTYGIWRPTILLSTWMIEHLDGRELEAVLAHEIGHIARRDYLIGWLATTLRDAFFYLPTSWGAYRELQHEKELACDDFAVHTTGRPLALASALAKILAQGSDRIVFEAAQSLAAAEQFIEQRIERLLGPRPPKGTAPSHRPLATSTGVPALLALVVLEALNAAVILMPMGCGPGFPLG